MSTPIPLYYWMKFSICSSSFHHLPFLSLLFSFLLQHVHWIGERKWKQKPNTIVYDSIRVLFFQANIFIHWIGKEKWYTVSVKVVNMYCSSRKYLEYNKKHYERALKGLRSCKVSKFNADAVEQNFLFKLFVSCACFCFIAV